MKGEGLFFGGLRGPVRGGGVGRGGVGFRVLSGGFLLLVGYCLLGLPHFFGAHLVGRSRLLGVGPHGQAAEQVAGQVEQEGAVGFEEGGCHSVPTVVVVVVVAVASVVTGFWPVMRAIAVSPSDLILARFSSALNL